MPHRLYRSPALYDAAFAPGTEAEAAAVLALARRHAGLPVRSVLEPAAGTCRTAIELARHGLDAVGWDLSPDMLRHAQARLRRMGPGLRLGLVAGDMRDAVFTPVFQGAVSMANSFAYLLEDADVARHLSAMAAALRPGAAYVLQLSFALRDPASAEPGEWRGERDGLAVDASWEIVSEDAAARRSLQRCRLAPASPSDIAPVEEEHLLRTWTPREFEDAAVASGFSPAGYHWLDGTPVADPAALAGEDGNIYCVLRR